MFRTVQFLTVHHGLYGKVFDIRAVFVEQKPDQRIHDSGLPGAVRSVNVVVTAVREVQRQIPDALKICKFH